MKDTWNNAYALWVDGVQTKIELLGTSKSRAYEMLADEWYKYHPGTPPPAKRRCKLEFIEGTRNY